MKQSYLVVFLFICNLCYGQYGVSLGKDGERYQGETFRQNGWVSPVAIPLGSYYNLYDKDGIRFSIKLVIGDDPFDRGIMTCEPNDPMTTNDEKLYSGDLIYHFRVVLLIENTNPTKEVEFINLPAFSVAMENIGTPTVFSVCNNDTSTSLKAFTGSIQLGTNSSLEICDPHHGAWFFSQPMLTEWFVSDYVLRTENPTRRNPQPPTVSCDNIPITRIYNMGEEPEAEEDKQPTNPADKGVSISSSSGMSINTKRPQVVDNDFWNGNGDESEAQSNTKQKAEDDAFWNSTDTPKPKPKPKPPVKKTTTPQRNSSSSSRTSNTKPKSTNSNPLVGKWVQISGNYGTNKNGESNYFYFSDDGVGHTFVPDEANKCEGYGLKTHFNYTNTSSNVSLRYTKQDTYCGTSANVAGKSASAGFSISGDILTISGVKFRRTEAKEKTSSGSLIGKWVRMDSNCLAPNGDSEYFIFNSDGSGELLSTNCIKVCLDNIPAAKYSFTYTDSSISISYLTDNSNCELSDMVPWSLRISNYRITNDILNIGEVKFKRQ